MIEFEMMKTLIFGKDGNILKIFSRFKPILKVDYSDKYEKKLEDLYASKMSENELQEYLNAVKNCEFNENFLDELKFFNWRERIENIDSWIKEKKNFDFWN